ncbi:hypothetical protein FOCC_FOCC007438 [Frankliniella occidentalis]|uniref:NADH dehydrogenase [ubiquinone] 1 beta subcomplex subunit 4 n=1 Tax=Frankliniella occidentalis TaxID=133901 RepID=A0A6J1S4N5_FRAOC|nr:uncharacterized protein LOC113204609 [Frankliniella occidentalis]KAE8745921.1 hypothetical protein FOCC_FOCC007438 [Frankliniella occidentalis]
MIPKGTPTITLSNREIRAIQDKARQRQELREFLIKEKSNPFKTAAAMGTGYIMDPAFQRYEAAQSFMSEWTHGRPTLKSGMWFLGAVIAPIVGIGLWAHFTRKEFEGRCRRGEISYFDRNNKFV